MNTTYGFDLTGLPPSLALSVALAHADASLSDELARIRGELEGRGLSGAEVATVLAHARAAVEQQWQGMEAALTEWLAEGDAATRPN